MKPKTNDSLRWIELILLFLLVPILIFFIPLAIPKLPSLLIISIACGVVLLRDPNFLRNQLWGPRSLKSFTPLLLVRALLITIFLVGFVCVFNPTLLLSFLREKPRIWLLVMAFYPLLSAYPQELIYRAFFFHRYQGFFRTEAGTIWASAIAFAFMHIIFRNPVAPLLTLPAGYLFATTYTRTRSLLTTGIEHALYGDLVFTIGLGVYFYKGA